MTKEEKRERIAALSNQIIAIKNGGLAYAEQGEFYTQHSLEELKEEYRKLNDEIGEREMKILLFKDKIEKLNQQIEDLL